MFGDISGMMKKLKVAQQKVEETKLRLDTVLVDGEANSGVVKVTATANRKITSITIVDALLEDKEALEDYLVIALNDAITKASNIHDAEMAAAAKDGMPNIPGMNLFK